MITLTSLDDENKNKTEYIDMNIWNIYQETLKSAQSKREYYFALKDVCIYSRKAFLDINHIDAQAYFNYLRTTRLKASTITARQAKLRSISNFLIRQANLLDIEYSYNPFVNINFMPETSFYIDSSHVPDITELDNLLSRASFDPELYLVLALVIKCGLSTGEICQIRMSDFFLDSIGYPYLKIAFKGKSRDIKISSDVVDILNAYANLKCPSTYLFENRNKKPLRVRDLERHYQKLFYDVSYTLSDIRNGAIAAMLAQGIPQASVAAYLGITPVWLRRFEPHIPEMGLQAIDLNRITIKSLG